MGFGVKELQSGGNDGGLANKRTPKPDGGGEMLKIQHVYCMGAILFLLVKGGAGLVVTSPQKHKN